MYIYVCIYIYVYMYVYVYILHMSIKTLFQNDQGEVNNILREKNQNIWKQLKQRRQKKWEKFIDRLNYGYYVPDENPGEKSVIDHTKMIDRIQPVNDVKRVLHKKYYCLQREENF